MIPRVPVHISSERKVLLDRTTSAEQPPKLSRRGLLRGAGLILAAPAIVKIANIMPVKVLDARAGFWVESVGYSFGRIVATPEGVVVRLVDSGELERAFIDTYLRQNDLLTMLPFRRA